MRSRQRLAISGFLSLLALTVLFGCRAFQPEVVVVNKPPETYILGAPAETSGGYYHYRVWWYGTDLDGDVTRYVWALTDTSVQDHTLDGDEEDTRFNPATNISTLRIGNWTTRTDTVFDFSIRQGANLAYDMTLHMVAVDDRGDFDRTPARLYFISNALSNPWLTFSMTVDGVTRQVGNADTVGFGVPFTLSWTAQTGNIRSFAPELLAERDTVPPADGLLGFKFRIMDVPCDESREDCWRPRRFRAGVGDSVSFFGLSSQLVFANDNSGADVLQKRLSSGAHRVLVNTIDVAGVEVPATRQAFNIISNFDPDTRLLRGERDPVFTDDPETYPYYIVYHKEGETIRQEKRTFVEGQTVPDRAYVVFKALGWDDSRDRRRGAGGVKLQGAFEALGLYGGNANFRFSSDFSDTLPPTWSNAAGVCADTVGFLVGSFDYTFTMRSMDEHQRRDETPERFFFKANHPPCVQCVELLVGSELQSGGPFDCQDSRCREDEEIFARFPDIPDTTSLRWATPVSRSPLWVNLNNNTISFTPPPVPSAEWWPVDGAYYEYRLAFHGADDALETWDPARPQDRMPAWNYEILAQGDASASPPLVGDSNNTVNDGGGVDGLEYTTYRWARYDPSDPTQEIYVDDEGVWVLRIRFFVPTMLFVQGSAGYLTYLRGDDPSNYQEKFNLSTMMLGNYRIRVLARDASNCVWNSQRSMYRHYFGLRAPAYTGTDRDLHPRWNCTTPFPRERRRSIDEFRKVSEVFAKNFRIRVRTLGGEIYP